jgi:fibronectin-binding autotransporter adhesin
MKTITRHLQSTVVAHLRWLALLLAISFVPMLTHAQQPIVLTANDAAGTTSFNTVGHWSNAQAPSGANEYNSTNLLRTPGDANNYTFAGHSMTMGIPASYANGTLIDKGAAGIHTITINNLTNAGGLMRSGATPTSTTIIIAGNQFFQAVNSTILADQSEFVISSPLVGGDGIVLTNNGNNAQTITFGGTNSAFTGEFFLGANAVVVFSNANSVLGNPSTPNPGQYTLSGSSSLNDTVGVVLNNANGGITLLGSATINNTATTIVAVPIAGGTNFPTLTKNGTGILVLSNAFNTYSNTTISAGTLQEGVANAIPAYNVTDNSTLDLNTFSTTIDGLGGSGAVDTVAGGTPTLTIGVNGGGGTFSGVIRNSSGILALTKVGAGTETLSGGYTYSGSTLVAGGTLVLTTASSLPSTAGNLAISNGAVLTVNATNGTPLPANSVTCGTNVTLNLNLAGVASGINAAGSLTFRDNAAINLNYGTVSANPTFAAINAAGGISAPGSNIVINITAIGVKAGQFPLIKYTGASLGGIANFVLGSLPPGVAATLANNTGNDSIDLNISATPRQITWSGVNGTSWDLTTFNWTNSDGTATVYRQITNGSVIAGDSVTFDNTLTNSIPQPTNVNLTAVFYPFPVVVNSTLPYSIGGTGGLAGSSGNTGIAYLTKNNTSSLTLLTSNSFTGGLAINAGTVIITNDFSLGANASVVTLNGGTLQVNGNTINNARTFSVPATSSIGVATNVTAQFGGAITGGGGLIKTDNGTLVLAGTNSIRGPLTVNQGTLTTLGTNVLATVPIIGNAAGFNGVLNIAGGSFQANTNTGSASISSLVIGGVAGAAGDVVMSSGTLTVNRQLAVGSADYGAFSQSGGTTTIGGFIACGGTADGGIFNQSGGTIGMNGSSVTIGYSAISTFGVMNLSGNAVFNMIGSGNGVWPGEVGNGTLNVSGNAALTITNDGVALGRNTGTGTVNLNGGTITVNFITNGPVAGTFNFNGGTLKANANSSSFTKGTANKTAFYDYSGGATIDDGGFAITFSQPLLVPTGYGVASIPVPPGTSWGYIDAPIVTITDLNAVGSNATAIATVSGGAVTGIVITCPGSGFDLFDSYVNVTFAGGGPNAVSPYIDPTTVSFVANGTAGLSKKGSGTLTMSGLNTFAGAVNVNAGTLSMTTASTLTGPTTVTNGATFSISQIGSATSSISNLTFVGGAAVPGATLGLGISAANNTAIPVVNCGIFTVNGTNSINLAGAVQVGSIPLVKYAGALGGSGTITNLILPQGAAGFISNSTASSTLYAVVTSTGPGLVWTGTNSNASLTNLWDLTSTTINWLLGATPTAYHQSIIPGDAVTFNDSGSGTVVLNTNAGPSSLVISNNNVSYTFRGLGSISGSTGLQKLGSGTAFLNLTNNSYTGDTVISNGTLQVGNPTALSSAANLNVGPGGTLELNGFGQLAGATAASGSVAGLSGSGIIDNNSPQNVTLIVGSGSGGTWNGTIKDHGAGGVSLTKVGNNTLVIGGTNHLDDGSLTGFSSVDVGTMIITNGGVLNLPYAQFYVGSVAGSSGTNIVAGGTLVLSNNLLAVGRGSATANGTLIVNSGTVQKTGANNIVVGSTGATGTLIVNGGQVLNNGALWLGDGSTANATLYLNGGLIQATSIIPNGSPTLTPIAYFNGGTLQATTNSANFLQVQCEVMSNGLALDDNGYTLSIGAVVLFAGDVNNGGFVKKGSGTVYLDTANQYTGTTLVNNGTLAGVGSIHGSVVVVPAGNLGSGDAAGITPGTPFTIAGNLTLQGNATLRINKTGGSKVQDNVTVNGSITYGGVLTVNNITSDSTALAIGDTFQLFNVTGSKSGNFTSVVGSGATYSFDPTTGILTVTSIVVGPGTFTNKTGITSLSVNGANIVITGTNGQAGDAYYLLQSTNMALPLSQWKVTATNVLSANGNFTFTGTNAVVPGNQQQFYLLSNTNSNH